MFGSFPENAIRLFLSNTREGSGGLVQWNVLSLSRTGTVPVNGIAEAEAETEAVCVLLSDAASRYNTRGCW